MIDKFHDMLIRTLIAQHDFLPLRDTEGNLIINEHINMLTKNSMGSNVIVELLDGDWFTNEEIKARLQENKRVLSELKDKAAYYFFEIIFFHSEIDGNKLDTIESSQFQNKMGKKYLGCISIDLPNKNVLKHFTTPKSDLGLTKTIIQLISNGIPGDIENEDINNMVLRKEKEYEIDYKVKSPVLTYTFIAVNVIVFALLYLYSGQSGLSYNKLLIDYGARENSLIISGQYWRLITPIFLHANLVHLLVNCYSIYAVGVLVERILGRARFLTVYLIAGILGNIAGFMFSTNAGVGASGAIFGLLGTLLYFGLEKPALFKSSFGYNVIIITVINLVYGFSNSGIDNYAHIGGLIGGFLVSGAVWESKKSRWYLNRYLYIVLTAVIIFSGLFYGFNNNQGKIISGINELQKLDKAQDWSGAEAKGEELLKLDPSNTNNRINILFIITKAEAVSGKYNEAVEHGKMLKQIDPIDGHYLLGVIYYDMKEFKLSKEELLAAKKAGNDNELIDKLLGEIH